jgi:hypothetical protein
VLVWDELAERTGDKELQLIPLSKAAREGKLAGFDLVAPVIDHDGNF